MLCIVGAILLIVQVQFELQQIRLVEEEEETQPTRQQEADRELPVGAPEAWREGGKLEEPLVQRTSHKSNNLTQKA